MYTCIYIYTYICIYIYIYIHIYIYKYILHEKCHSRWARVRVKRISISHKILEIALSSEHIFQIIKKICKLAIFEWLDSELWKRISFVYLSKVENIQYQNNIKFFIIR